MRFFMGPAKRLRRLLTGSAFLGCSFLVAAGTWSDQFSQSVLGSDWQGDREAFSIVAGALKGVSASPLAPVPLNRVEVGQDWADYTVQCRINVVEPNLLVCTKGALVLRDNGTEGYVFALHVATKTVEVYRLSDHEMLLSKDAPLELKTWYLLGAELHDATMSFFVDGQLIGSVTDDRSPSGRVGVAVQDALVALFDDFTVTGPGIPDNGLELSLGQKITITWPTSFTNYVLETTTQLLPGTTWDTITNAPSVAGGEVSVTLERSAGPSFYRLVQRSP